MKIQPAMKALTRVLNRRMPEILTGLGIASMLSATVSAVKVTPEATRRTYDAISETTEVVTFRDKVRLNIDLYVPAAIYTVLGVTMIVSAQTINSRRQSALMALLATTETTLSRYMKSVEESVDIDMHERIRNSLAQKTIDDAPEPQQNLYFDEDNPPIKFIDGLSGRTFYSDIQTIRSAVNDVNEEIVKFNYASQNSLYAHLGLDSVQLGDDCGWDIDNKLEINYRTGTDKNGVPCYYLDYQNRPKLSYY